MVTRFLPPAMMPALACMLLFCAPAGEGRTAPGRIGRIVSLSPSITRQIVDLDAAKLLAGVTSYDDYRRPGVAIVGTLVQPNIERIIMLEPDIVLFSEEDGQVQNVERIARTGLGVCRFRRNRDFTGICENYLDLGRMVGRERKALSALRRYREDLDRIKKTGMAGRRTSVAFFVSCRPLIAASPDSFVGKIIRDAGGACAYGGTGRPYPLVSMESLLDADPDLIILMAGEGDAGIFIRELSEDFGSLRAVAGGNIHAIPPDTIPYYTPGDYVASAETIARIIRSRRNQHND
ncbi:MAG: ABC transporter substrate-binding protein [Spirochaetes bacterium]|nr:ABC transporter substrate-binding protein [Spirochaetota bacterium]